MIGLKARKGSNSLERLNVLVAVRVRPLNSEEKEKSQSIVKADGISKTVSCKLKQFGPFDFVYPPSTAQSKIFEDIVLPQVKKVLAGFNCTVFAYGQTGTGKTFTMEGGRPDSDSAEADVNTGMTPRAVEHIFTELENAGVEEYSVRVSYLELYNEEIYDLLSCNTEDRERLRIFDDPSKKGAVIVSGAEEVPVRSRREVYDILKRGAEKRTVAATLMNIASSRSHSIFTISVVIRENTESGEELVKTGKLNLVDLAGSENIGRSGAEGKRMKEAGNINQSLLTLGRVITALTSSGPHVPYRESKLTRILQDSLGGSTITAIIATMSPAGTNYEESISTLDYAMRAKAIRNHPECNQKVSRKTLLKEYNIEIEKLRRDLRMAREKNGIYLSEETYTNMEKDIASKDELIQELTGRMDIMVSKLQRFIEDMEMMDDQYREVYQTSKRLQSKLESRVNELDLTKKDLAIAQQKLSAHQYALDDFSETAKSCYQQAKEACTIVWKQRDYIEELWSKDADMVDIALRNKNLVDSCIKKVSNLSSLASEKFEEFLNGIGKSKENNLDNLESFQVSAAADIEVILSELAKLQVEISNCESNTNKLFTENETILNNIISEKSEKLHSLLANIDAAKDAHTEAMNNIGNEMNEKINMVCVSTQDLLDQSKTIESAIRSQTDQFVNDHSSVTENIAVVTEQHKSQMEEVWKNFRAYLDQGESVFLNLMSSMNNSKERLEEIQTTFVDQASTLNEQLSSVTKNAVDAVNEKCDAMRHINSSSNKNVETFGSNVASSCSVGFEIVNEQVNQIKTSCASLKETLSNNIESSNKEQMSLIEVAQGATNRVNMTISDQVEDSSDFIKELASTTGKFTSEGENTQAKIRAYCDECEDKWSHDDGVRREKVHDDMFPLEDIRTVPKKKEVLCEYGFDQFDERSVTRTRESLLEIKNLCSPDTLAMKKKSRFADITEETENISEISV